MECSNVVIDDAFSVVIDTFKTKTENFGEGLETKAKTVSKDLEAKPNIAERFRKDNGKITESES
jgi:hypothetical protein